MVSGDTKLSGQAAQHFPAQGLSDDSRNLANSAGPAIARTAIVPHYVESGVSDYMEQQQILTRFFPARTRLLVVTFAVRSTTGRQNGQRPAKRHWTKTDALLGVQGQKEHKRHDQEPHGFSPEPDSHNRASHFDNPHHEL